MSNFDYIETKGAPIKAWTKGVPVEDKAREQLENVARMPFIHECIAVMPDVHWGFGATVGSVIPSKGAIIPAAVGVDIGCGMMAVQTSLTSRHLPDNLAALRSAIEAKVPHGRTHQGGRGDSGAWGDVPNLIAGIWAKGRRQGRPLAEGLAAIAEKHPKIAKANHVKHLGTLGTGNHFIEICLDQTDRVWVMLHSGSRGIGARIGTYFIGRAKREMERASIDLPDKDLAYLAEGSELFDDYVEAVGWAQEYALINREVMMERVLGVLEEHFSDFALGGVAVNCHHNYVARERHFGADVWLTRKGAIRACEGELGIIPGSMGTRSYIVRGKGNRDSFNSCSHGAGRRMSRRAARKAFSMADHAKATEGVECRKDADVIDETPGAYKDIDAVMAAQTDLAEVVHTLKQIVCVKG